MEFETGWIEFQADDYFCELARLQAVQYDFQPFSVCNSHQTISKCFHYLLTALKGASSDSQISAQLLQLFIDFMMSLIISPINSRQVSLLSSALTDLSTPFFRGVLRFFTRVFNTFQSFSRHGSCVRFHFHFLLIHLLQALGLFS